MCRFQITSVALFCLIFLGLGNAGEAQTLGRVYAWGENGDGQASTAPDSSQCFIGIGAGTIHGFGILPDSTLYGWGGDAYGAISSAPPSKFVAVDGGRYWTAGITANGALAAWGRNWSELGCCNNLAVPGGTSYVEIAVSGMHAIARRSNGTLVGWGRVDIGNANINASVPEAVANLTYTTIAAGQDHGIGLTTDGHIKAWGVVDPQNYEILDTPWGFYVDVAGGREIAYALRPDGTVLQWAWEDTTSLAVVLVDPNLVSICAGYKYGVGLRADGSILTWGWDYSGLQSDAPGGTGFFAVSCGHSWVLALASKTTLHAPSLSGGLVLFTPRPSPTSGPVSIPYSLTASGHIRLDVLDVQGRTVITLFDGFSTPGTRSVSWDGRRSDGSATSPGVYFVSLTSSAGVQMAKLVRIP